MLPLNLAQAGVLERLKRHKEAAEVLEAAAALRPQDPDLAMRLAKMRAAAGEDAAASGHLRQVLSAQPDNPEAAARLAWLSVDKGDAAEAERLLKVASAGLPAGPAKELAAGWLHQLAGRVDQALECYVTVTSVEPDNERAWELMAGLLYRRSQLKDAQMAYQKLAELKPGHVEAQIRLGSLHLKLGRRDLAQQAWEAALRLDPNNTIVRKNLSVLKA